MAGLNKVICHYICVLSGDQNFFDSGVLLLNTVLTVKAHNAKSHADQGWETLTDAVIKKVSEKLDGVVFLLWGAPAIKKAALIDKVLILLLALLPPIEIKSIFNFQKKHHILSSVHPSPLSAHRGFFGNHHFSKCNELLKKQGKSTIEWKNLPSV